MVMPAHQSLHHIRTQLSDLLNMSEHSDKPVIVAHLASVLNDLETGTNTAERHSTLQSKVHRQSPSSRIGTFDDENPLISKLSRVMALSLDDRTALQAMCREVRQVGVRRDIIRDGDRPDRVHLILKGWACRYKILSNGKRQIMALLLPGDFCDLHVSMLDQMDHTIASITATTFAYVDRSQFDELTRTRPAILRALWWATLVDEGVLRSWIVSLGARSARERVAHLICELRERMRNINAENSGQFDMPLTQPDLAEALGLTPIHINRVVRQLLADKVVEIHRGEVTVLDQDALVRIADFDPSYLHAQSIDQL